MKEDLIEKLQSLPGILKEGKRFVLWGYKNRAEGHSPKKPFQPSGKWASPTDESTWCTFDEAIEGLRSGDFLGIGRGIPKLDGLVGVDLDHVILQDGRMTSWAEALVDQLESYTELSPSGNGAHIWVKGDVSNKGKTAIFETDGGDSCQIISEKGYLTLTGEKYGEVSGLKEKDTRLGLLFQELHDRATIESALEKNKQFRDIFTNTPPEGPEVNLNEIDLGVMKDIARIVEDDTQAIRIYNLSAPGRYLRINPRRHEIEDYIPRTLRAARAAIRKKEGETHEIDTNWKINWVTDFKSVKEIPYLVKGFIAQKSIMIFASPPKSGKSYLMVDLVEAIASGQKFLGRKTHPGVVVYVAAEGSEQDTQNRFLGIAQYRNCNENLGNALVVFHAPRLGVELASKTTEHTYDTQTLVEKVSDEMRSVGHQPESLKLLIIDTMHATIVGKVNEQRDVAIYMRALATLRDQLGCAVVLCHHTPKSKEQKFTEASGSVNITGSADGLVIIRIVETKIVDGKVHTKLEIRVAEQRIYAKRKEKFFVLLKETDLKNPDGLPALDSEGEPITSAVIEVLDTEVEEKIIKETKEKKDKTQYVQVLECLVEDPSPLSATQIAKSVEIPKGSLRRVLGELNDRNLINRLGVPGEGEFSYSIRDEGREYLKSPGIKTPVTPKPTIVVKKLSAEDVAIEAGRLLGKDPEVIRRKLKAIGNE